MVGNLKKVVLKPMPDFKTDSVKTAVLVAFDSNFSLVRVLFC